MTGARRQPRAWQWGPVAVKRACPYMFPGDARNKKNRRDCLQRSTSRAQRSKSYFPGVAKDLQELQDLVEEINTWLQTVGDKAIRNDQSSNWIKKLKDAAYDAEDLVHDFHIQAEKHGARHKIKEIKKRFDAIVKGRSDYSTIANCIPVDLPVQHRSKTTGENVKLVSVNGLGGTGKTTLAKLIFNDTNIIKGHFEVILWVHVPREFVVENLVEKLFEAIASDKFLLVLDDVWTEDRIHWEQFMTDSWKVFQQSFGIAWQGVLRGMKGIEEWESIRDSSLLDVEGHTMNKQRLISQWIAHGFVNPTNRGQLEDVGIGYFDSLLKVGFLQI
ncbi:hypothetical protein BAE44_0016227 [Dichanthelium oligosanthes]|uniref:Disease resistance RPP13-like protein 1 n=1 Tax=Dichanthelium oligosanthes TaxID=888268 RepID=A0A1E5VCH9_9POAL|nr:hypothetical protein BAE44_0016227 [Dichanthelium oligosanthes]